ncbi:MAG TPA: alpha/beta fold hydrolase [Polyangiales bacterium]|nr:alpha/beta fold hydrolase [Polyangiales bacterium]
MLQARSNPRWTLLVAALMVAVALLLTAALRRQRDRFHYYTGGQDSALPRLLEAHGYQLRELQVAPNVRLRGVLRLPSSPRARFMLFFPGNSEPQLTAAIPALEGLRAGRDLGIAAFAYRGFEGSSGRPSVAASEHDAQAQLAYLREQLHVTPERLVVVGYSMGSGIALRLAAERSRAGQPPAAVVLLSPFWTLELGPASPFELLLPSELYRMQDIATEYRGPLLVVAGDADHALPVAEHAHRLLQALPKTTLYWELPGRGHVDYLHDNALLARVGSFVLGREP